MSREQSDIAVDLSGQHHPTGGSLVSLTECIDSARDVLHVQITPLHREAAQLAHEQEVFEEARRKWEIERHELTQRLASQTDRLIRLEAALLARNSRGEVDAANREEPAMGRELAVAGQLGASATLMPNALAKQEGGDALERVRALMAEPTDTRQRGGVTRDRLSMFIGERLVQLDRSRQRRHFMIWGGALLATSLVVTLSILTWNWLSPMIVR